MNLLQILLGAQRNARMRGRRDRSGLGSAGTQRFEPLPRQIDQPLMSQIAGRRDQQVGRRVHAAIIILNQRRD